MMIQMQKAMQEQEMPPWLGQETKTTSNIPNVQPGEEEGAYTSNEVPTGEPKINWGKVRNLADVKAATELSKEQFGESKVQFLPSKSPGWIDSKGQFHSSGIQETTNKPMSDLGKLQYDRDMLTKQLGYPDNHPAVVAIDRVLAEGKNPDSSEWKMFENNGKAKGWNEDKILAEWNKLQVQRSGQKAAATETARETARFQAASPKSEEDWREFIALYVQNPDQYRYMLGRNVMILPELINRVGRYEKEAGLPPGSSINPQLSDEE
jgi:hypothetical protein